MCTLGDMKQTLSPEVFTKAVFQSVAFWVVKPCSLVRGYWHSRDTYSCIITAEVWRWSYHVLLKSSTRLQIYTEFQPLEDHSLMDYIV
jgi:hypothetical protein